MCKMSIYGCLTYESIGPLKKYKTQSCSQAQYPQFIHMTIMALYTKLLSYKVVRQWGTHDYK